MVHNLKYKNTDLVAVVWPRQNEPRVTAHEATWEEVSRGRWAMDPTKAERVRILVAIHDDVIRDAWAVTDVKHNAEVPAGKTRKVSRSTFTTAIDPRLAYLTGMDTPLPRRRNPQATMELRDLPGAGTLTETAPLPPHGLVQLGDFTLSVSVDGRAELRIPVGAEITIRAGQRQPTQ